MAGAQVSIKFVSNIDEFAAEQRFYSSMPAASTTGSNLADFVPRLHDTIVGSSTTWSGEHHPPAFVQERGHFSLEVFPSASSFGFIHAIKQFIVLCVSFNNLKRRTQNSVHFRDDISFQHPSTHVQIFKW